MNNEKKLNLTEDFKDVKFEDVETTAGFGLGICCNSLSEDELSDDQDER